MPDSLAPRRLLVVGKRSEALEPFRDAGEELGYEAMATTDAAEARRMVELAPEALAALVCVLVDGEADVEGNDMEMTRLRPVAHAAKRRSRQTFVAVVGARVASSAPFRQRLFAQSHEEDEDAEGGGLEANMATAAGWEMRHVLTQIMDIHTQQRLASNAQNRRTYACPYCGLQGLTEDGLHVHFPLYHVSEANAAVTCPICSKSCDAKRGDPFPPHLENTHGPPGRDGRPNLEELEGPSLYAFALVVVRSEVTGKFLLVQEFGASGWWLPGGRIDPGEGFAVAACRECEEEAGIAIEITGILRIEFSPSELQQQKKSSRTPYARMRVVFLGKPKDPLQLPKGIADYESVGAAWATAEEVEHALPLRGNEPRTWIPYVAKGGPVYPLSLLTVEGTAAPPVV